MTPDQYVQSALQRYVVNRGQAQSLAERIAPSIRTWAGSQLSNLTYSGSYAKGTGNTISTDVDLFISLRADTQNSLKDIYGSLFNLAQSQGWSPRSQNVSIGISVSGRKIDLVPGRIQSGYQNYHSLYRRKTDSWTQTNVKIHIDTVAKSGRVEEIRAIKLWRDLHNLAFSSFYLELIVIEALKGRSTNALASNVMHALNDLATNLSERRIIDPANSNNIISDDLSPIEKTAIENQARISAAKPNWGGIIW